MAPASTFDPVRYKADTRAEWRDAADGWRTWAGVLEAADAGLAVSRRLVELARVRPGAAVLDVAAGYGEPGLTAARAAGPAGRVVCADLSGPMLALARERAAAAGLGNLEFVEADAEALDLPEASFDAVLSRQGLQFLTDVPGTLARLRSFLVPGGRLAAAVWGPPARVPFVAPVPVIRAELDLAPPPAGTPGPFALGDRARLRGQLEAAGFREVATGTATATYRFASPEQATRWLRDVAPPITALVAGQPPEVEERVWARATAAWAPFTDAGGRVRLDNQVLWVTGAR